jgi:hypothetical protein
LGENFIDREKRILAENTIFTYPTMTNSIGVVLAAQTSF